MRFNWKYLIIFLTIILGAVIVRFYQLDKIPPGLIIDEASEGYNAFSIIHTGRDRYDESFPILFRSFGSFQAPLYTYLSIVPIYFFGNSIYAIRFIAASFGVILVITTFFLLVNTGKRKTITLSVIAAFLVVISPWAVFFSRIATEANLGVSLLALSFLIFYHSLKRPWFFPVATFILGLSTQAYYSERLVSAFFLVGFILLFKKNLLSNKKMLIFGLILFGVTQIPHLMIVNSGAFTRRISQVDYFSDQFFQQNSGSLRYFPFGRVLYIIREFMSQYFAYFSPRNLFFDPDPQGARSMPDVSVFYNWMILPFIFGLRELIKRRSLPLFRMLILLIIISPIPASLTRDPFSTIRTLDLLWGFTIIIAIGVNYLLNIYLSFKLKLSIIILIISLSLIQLYLSYFILLKYERSEAYGYTYLELLKIMETEKDKKFVVDSTRELGTGIRYAFLKGYDPLRLQKVLGSRVKGQYYSNFEFDEPYALDNIEARPIVWREDLCKEQILVGDYLAISTDQVKEHNLKFLFDVKNIAGEVILKAYSTKSCKTTL